MCFWCTHTAYVRETPQNSFTSSSTLELNINHVDGIYPMLVVVASYSYHSKKHINCGIPVIILVYQRIRSLKRTAVPPFENRPKTTQKGKDRHGPLPTIPLSSATIGSQSLSLPADHRFATIMSPGNPRSIRRRRKKRIRFRRCRWVVSSWVCLYKSGFYSKNSLQKVKHLLHMLLYTLF